MPRAPRPYRVSDGGWRFTVRGKKFWRASEADAWATLAKLTLDVSGKHPAPLSVTGLIERWESAHGNSHASEMLNEFDSWSLSPGGDRHLCDVDDETLHRFARYVQSRKSARGGMLSRETIRKKVLYAATVLRWANQRGWIERAPAVPKLPKPPPAPKALTTAELEAFFVELRRSKKTKHAEPLIRFILECGCRPGEARLLRWSEVKFDQNVVVLTRHKTDATGESRIIPLSTTALEIIKSRPRAGRYVFTSYRGQPYTRDGFASILKRREISPYRLRHTWCQNATNKGVADRTISAIMGHRSSKMVEMYRAIADQTVRAAVATLDGLSRVEFRAQHPIQTAPSASPPSAGETARSPRARTGTRDGAPADKAGPPESRRGGPGRRRRTG